eukprot:m.250212 g.250212  ORF g.250212 m.250212 type:complete len:355 (+) comp26490_c0_seq50:371-1435(+)
MSAWLPLNRASLHSKITSYCARASALAVASALVTTQPPIPCGRWGCRSNTQWSSSSSSAAISTSSAWDPFGGAGISGRCAGFAVTLAKSDPSGILLCFAGSGGAALALAGNLRGRTGAGSSYLGGGRGGASASSGTSAASGGSHFTRDMPFETGDLEGTGGVYCSCKSSRGGFSYKGGGLRIGGATAAVDWSDMARNVEGAPRFWSGFHACSYSPSSIWLASYIMPCFHCVRFWGLPRADSTITCRVVPRVYSNAKQYPGRSIGYGNPSQISYMSSISLISTTTDVSHSGYTFLPTISLPAAVRASIPSSQFPFVLSSLASVPFIDSPGFNALSSIVIYAVVLVHLLTAAQASS